MPAPVVVSWPSEVCVAPVSSGAAAWWSNHAQGPIIYFCYAFSTAKEVSAALTCARTVHRYAAATL